MKQPWTKQEEEIFRIEIALLGKVGDGRKLRKN